MAVDTTSDLNTNNNSKEDNQAKSVSCRRWFVMTSGYFVIFLCSGFAFNLSVLVPELLRTFGRSKTETALVQSITAGMVHVAGTFCGKFLSRYGVRSTGITGSLLATLGLVFSFFATNIPHLIVTLGIVSAVKIYALFGRRQARRGYITKNTYCGYFLLYLIVIGLGFSATFISAYTSVGEYFEGKSKLMALAFLTLGSGCGGMVIPLLLDALIDEFGWRGSLLIMGGLMANMVCLFAICKPVSVGISYTRANDSKENSEQDGFSFTNSLKSLVANTVYVTHVIAMCCTIPVINSSKIFIIDFLMTKGFDSKAQMRLFLCLQIGTTFGGIVPGILKRYIPHTSVLFIPAFFTMVGTIVFAFLPNAETYTNHVLLLISLGMTLGVSITTLSMTTMKLVGLQNYTVGLGILMTLLGISGSIGGAATGLLLDLTESYTKPFYGCSIGLGSATCLFVFAGALKRRKKTTHQCDMELNIAPVVKETISPSIDKF